jgi:hypothetical protein
MRRFLIMIMGLILTVPGISQEFKTNDFLPEIVKFDISDLLTLEKFIAEIETDTSEIKRMAPLGFIGDNYQRLHIHFTSVIQNPNNRLIYFVYGKSKVKTNICSFQGLFTIKDAKTYTDSNYLSLKRGFVTGEYEFFEDPDQRGTGVFKGIFRTDFFIDQKNIIHYDALDFVADGYRNNQFQGTWSAYKSKDSKKCNWGDYRMPECTWLNGCDTGAGEFGINDRYLMNGWENYILAWQTNQETPEVLKARQREEEKWWIDK